MTDLDVLHANAGLDLLYADTALTVYEGLVPNPTLSPLEPVDPADKPYVVVHTLVEWSHDGAAANAANPSNTCTTRWFCHCVGATATAARIVAGRVRTALLDVVPTVTGRQCFPIRQDSSLAPARDESSGTPIFEATAVYRLVTTP